MKVLLAGHPCCPGMGSEWGVTWNWARHLAARHDVWVLAHPEHRQAVEAQLAHSPAPTLRFAWVRVNPLLDPWTPERQWGSARLHYVLWQRAALGVARRLHSVEQFDVIHQVSWATIGAPPLLWRLPVPFVGGPVGGGQEAPRDLIQYFGRNRFKEYPRSARVRVAPYLPSMRRAVRQSAAIIATNQDTASVLAQAGAGKVPCWPDAAVEAEMLHRPCHIRSDAENLVLHWTGHLEHRKGLPLALEALGQVKDTPWRMVVSGAGPLESDCRRLTARLNLANRVTFQGIVPRTTLLRQFRSAHGFLFTSLRDSFGYVVMDAMRQGLPVIALDHQGVGSHLPESCAYKIQVSSAETTRAALADAVRVWAGSEEVRRRMSLAAWSYAGSQTWAKRAEGMTTIYVTVVADRRGCVRAAASCSTCWRDLQNGHG